MSKIQVFCMMCHKDMSTKEAHEVGGSTEPGSGAVSMWDAVAVSGISFDENGETAAVSHGLCTECESAMEYELDLIDEMEADTNVSEELDHLNDLLLDMRTGKLSLNPNADPADPFHGSPWK